MAIATVTYPILPFSSLNLDRIIFIEVDSSIMNSLSATTIKLLTGSGPTKRNAYSYVIKPIIADPIYSDPDIVCGYVTTC